MLLTLLALLDLPLQALVKLIDFPLNSLSNQLVMIVLNLHQPIPAILQFLDLLHQIPLEFLILGLLLDLFKLIPSLICKFLDLLTTVLFCITKQVQYF